MIFITGCARSGTSLIAQILQAHGFKLGRVNRLYENMDVREDVLKPYLRRIGADPMGQTTLPDTDNLPYQNGLRHEVERKLSCPEPWAYKDAKLTLVWPVWVEAFPEAKWILVRRDAEKIAESCVRTTFMRAYSHEQGWLGWVAEHERRFERMRDVLDLIEVWPRDVVSDARAFAPVCAHVGVDFDLDETEACIDRSRWHQ